MPYPTRPAYWQAVQELRDTGIGVHETVFDIVFDTADELDVAEFPNEKHARSFKAEGYSSRTSK